MEIEPKLIDPLGKSRAREGETFVGNFPTETISEYQRPRERYVNEEVERMRNSGRYESVRTAEAYENGEKILGMRAIFATPKSNS